MATTKDSKAGAAKQAHSNGIKGRQPKADAAPPPAYFLSLTVQNFRCFGPEQTLDLSNGNGRPAQWTVILGNNGVGKTSLLQCLAGMQPYMEYLPFGPSGQDMILLSPSLLLYPEFSQLFVDRLNNGEASSTLPAVFMGNSICYGEKLSSPKVGSIFTKYSMGITDFGIETNSAELSTENIHGLTCYGYGATRRMGDSSLSERKESKSSDSLFSAEAALINAEEWLLQADYAANRESHLQKQTAKRRDQIKDILIELLPDVTDIRIAELRRDNLTPRVEVQTPYGWVHIQSLSLGYKTLIAWMVDLASRLFERYPRSKNPLAEPAVVLVDEIDLHLHPEWQRKLIGDLTKLFPNTQFIVTAHSPLVVQAAIDANIVLLRREGDHVVIDNDVKAIEGWRVDQVLTSDLFGLESARPPQLDTVLQERNKILGKATLTRADKARLKKLEAEIGQLPTGETPDDLEAMDIIRRAAILLQNGQDGA